MEKIGFHGVAMGGKLYSLRMAKRMTQEQAGGKYSELWNAQAQYYVADAQ